MLSELNYDTRVKAGRVVEKEILDTLRKNGVQITDPTSEEDMADKIDGWMEWQGKQVSVQVKFREGGDDVIFEILKDVDRNIEGRDMISKATYYIVMDRANVIRMFSVEQIKAMAKLVKKHVLGEMTENPEQTTWGSNKACTVKITVDNAHGNRKMMAFFNPKMLKSLGEWHKQ